MKKNFYIIAFTLINFLLNGQICPISTTSIELIRNGAFELTNNATNGEYFSDYTWGNNALGSVRPGFWGIGTNPRTMDNPTGSFAIIGDHTTGTGNMMVIDADGITGKDAYNTTVNVTPNTTYFFSAWFVNIGNLSQATPQLRFSINNIVVGNNVIVSNVSAFWQQFFVSWNSGTTSGNITIRIENMVNTSQGNDLAIDDISFSSDCSKINDRNTYGKNSILPNTISTCATDLPVTLNTQLNSSNHTFNWKSPDGSFTSSASTVTLSTPPSYNKLYVCYDSIADGITCPKLDSVILSCVTPINFINFNYYPTENGIMLFWKTSNTSNETFIIETSTNGLTFNETGKTHHTSFVLESEKDMKYVRIANESKNGIKTYSNIVKIAEKENDQASIAPNPSNDSFTITTNLSGTCEITDHKGTTLSSKEFDGTFTTGSQLPKGLFFIKLITEEGIEVYKLVKE